MADIPAPDRTVLADTILSQASGTAVIDAPIERIDLFEWLRTLPDREYQRCAPPDHKAAGFTVTDDGQPMSVTVEIIGTDLFVQHYVYEIARRDHCRLVSLADVLTPAGWTSCQVIWELRADPVDGQISRCTNAVTSHPTAELIRLIAKNGQGFTAAAAAAQAALADHCGRETVRYAESIERHANAHG